MKNERNERFFIISQELDDDASVVVIRNSDQRGYLPEGCDVPPEAWSDRDIMGKVEEKKEDARVLQQLTETKPHEYKVGDKVFVNDLDYTDRNMEMGHLIEAIVKIDALCSDGKGFFVIDKKGIPKEKLNGRKGWYIDFRDVEPVGESACDKEQSIDPLAAFTASDMRKAQELWKLWPLSQGVFFPTWLDEKIKEKDGNHAQ